MCTIPPFANSMRRWRFVVVFLCQYSSICRRGKFNFVQNKVWTKKQNTHRRTHTHTKHTLKHNKLKFMHFPSRISIIDIMHVFMFASPSPSVAPNLFSVLFAFLSLFFQLVTFMVVSYCCEFTFFIFVCLFERLCIHVHSFLVSFRFLLERIDKKKFSTFCEKYAFYGSITINKNPFCTNSCA